MKRIIYHVTKRRDGWHVRSGRKFPAVTVFPIKRYALAFARQTARLDWHMMLKLAQVIVHDRHGRIQAEWSYGRDPRRSRG